MTPTDPDVSVIAHAIQLAVAPVFLLTGIASLLNVMATRLARIIDRARWLDQRWPALDRPARDRARLELGSLERRRRLTSRAINFSTAAALLVCLVVVVLFAEALFGIRLRGLTGVLFIATMLSLIGGLACFLGEVWLATHAIRIAAAEPD